MPELTIKNLRYMISLEKERALRTMENDMLWLLEQKGSKGYRWASTKRDLVEMVHEVWLRGVVYDFTGRVLPFTHLLKRVCDIVGVAVPKKPTSMLDNIAHRKDQEHLAITNRYMQILRSMHRNDPQLSLFNDERPILRFLERREERRAA